ncbi:MAG TPA: hypothetical protein VH277_16180 [Gemmatimonadaceae bacterium]|nr:hypothetical protein [Gemmatimonadaceae bacterium]
MTIFLDEARRAVLPNDATWVVDVELELDGTVSTETWRRVAEGPRHSVPEALRPVESRRRSIDIASRAYARSTAPMSAPIPA